MKVIKFEKGADYALELAKGKYKKLFIIGYDNEDYMRTTYDGVLTNEEKLWLLKNIEQALLNGEI